MKYETVRTRPLTGADASALSAFYLGLSPLTLHARFFVDSLSDPVSLGLTSMIDQRTHLAVVAERIGSDGAEIIGVARAVVPLGTPSLAEFAIVVADAWQRRGVGTALVKRLAGDSRRNGIDRWRAIRLTGNDRVDRLLGRVAVRESGDESGGVVDSTYRLVPALVDAG